MFKDRVIKLLIVATEKVVEYYFNEEENSGTAGDRQEQTNQEMTEEHMVETISMSTTFNLQRKFERLYISRNCTSSN